MNFDSSSQESKDDVVFINNSDGIFQNSSMDLQ